MLILTRRVGETLVIGEDIRITVTGVKGGQVRIGVDAPREVVVDREEIAQRKTTERQVLAATVAVEHATGSPVSPELIERLQDTWRGDKKRPLGLNCSASAKEVGQ